MNAYQTNVQITIIITRNWSVKLWRFIASGYFYFSYGNNILGNNNLSLWGRRVILFVNVEQWNGLLVTRSMGLVSIKAKENQHKR